MRVLPQTPDTLGEQSNDAPVPYPLHLFHRLRTYTNYVRHTCV